MNLTPQQRKALLIKTGKALFGERFGAPLAAGMGVDQSLISRIMKDERTVTDLQIQQLALFLGAEWQRLSERQKLIEDLVLEITGYPLEQQPHLIPGLDDDLSPQNQ